MAQMGMTTLVNCPVCTLPLVKLARGAVCKMGHTAQSFPAYDKAAATPEVKRLVSVDKWIVHDIIGVKHTLTRRNYEREEYDPNAAMLIRSKRRIRELVNAVAPTLNGQRKMQLMQSLSSISHAKQRLLETRSRALTKAERRALKRKRK